MPPAKKRKRAPVKRYADKSVITVDQLIDAAKTAKANKEAAAKELEALKAILGPLYLLPASAEKDSPLRLGSNQKQEVSAVWPSLKRQAKP